MNGQTSTTTDDSRVQPVEVVYEVVPPAQLLTLPNARKVDFEMKYLMKCDTHASTILFPHLLLAPDQVLMSRLTPRGNHDAPENPQLRPRGP